MPFNPQTRPRCRPLVHIKVAASPGASAANHGARVLRRIVSFLLVVEPGPLGAAVARRAALLAALTMIDQMRIAKRSIAESAWREILWVMPRDHEVCIEVSGGKVAVEFGPETPAPQGVAA